MEFTRSKVSWSNVKPRSENAPRLEELVDVLEFPKKEWVTVRFIGDVISDGVHWITIITKQGKKTNIPKSCLAHDSETQDRNPDKPCPYCELENQNYTVVYYSNAISRSAQDNQPKKSQPPTSSERKSGFKERGSKAWTPVRVVRITPTSMNQFIEMGERNVVRKGDQEKSFPISHPKYGRDISIKFDPDPKKGSQKYSFDKGERTPLTEEELGYLLQNLDLLPPPDSLKVAKEEAKKFADMAPSKGDSDDEEDNKKRKRVRLDEDDEPKSKRRLSDSDDEDEDEDEDKPKKSNDEDEDDDLGLDSDDEDEEEDKKPKSKSKKKSDDDDDEEEEPKSRVKRKVDDEDDEEDEKPRKKAKSKKSDDLDDLDEDEEDEKPKSRKKAKRDEEDEDDDIPY